MRGLNIQDSDLSDVDDVPLKADNANNFSRVGDFLNTSELYGVIASSNSVSVDSIPIGRKENCFFVFKNQDNRDRRQNQLKGRHWDDCGAWESGPTNGVLFLKSENGSLREIMEKDNLYGTIFQKRIEGKRKRVFVPLDPQPKEENIFKLHRAYSKHAKDANYCRRISWITRSVDLPLVAVAEYLGIFPGHEPHGNSTKNSRMYIRSKPSVQEEINQKSQNSTPFHVWQVCSVFCSETRTLLFTYICA